MVKVLEKILLALKWAQLGPKRGQNEVFGHFLVQNAVDFADFAYYDQEWQYLVPNGGQSAEKNFACPKMGPFGPNWALKWVFGNYLNFGSFDMFKIAYSDYFR